MTRFKERPEEGDTVWFGGQPLLITQCYKNLIGMDLVRCYDMVFHEKRAKAEREMKMLMKIPPCPEREYHILRIAPTLNGNCMSISLRVDSLKWWKERQAWVSGGRVLSGDQEIILKDLREQGHLRGLPVSV